MSRAKSICDRVYAVGGSELSAPEDAYVYVVDAGSELVMIDAGVGYGMKKIEENIRSLGWQPAQVWHIIATHCHVDHIGSLYAWKEQYGPKIIAHELDRAGIEGENDLLTAAPRHDGPPSVRRSRLEKTGLSRRLRARVTWQSFVKNPAPAT